MIDMDERARLILSEAFATIERSEAERDEVMADIAQRQADEVIYGNGRRLPNSKTVVDHCFDDGGLIYKTTQSEPKVVTMDAATAAGWEVWVSARIEKAVQKRLEDFATILGEEAALQEKRILTQSLHAMQRLDLELEALRSEIAILRTSKNVTPLRPRDVA